MQALDGVAEVATIGGMVKQYQVVVDPLRLRGYGIPLMMVEQAIRGGNQEVGGSVIEMAEAEYMVRATGYVKSLDDLRQFRHGDEGRHPVLLRDVAEVRLGPEMRRGIGELDGEGEAVGGVIVMRNGDNARDTIVRVKAKLDELRSGLPAGRRNRRDLRSGRPDPARGRSSQGQAARRVHRSRARLLRLPVSLALGSHRRDRHADRRALGVHRDAAQGINANIMSLGGIAIAIGTLVDAAIVMIENVHKKLEHWMPRTAAQRRRHERLAAIYEAAARWGPRCFSR